MTDERRPSLAEVAVDLGRALRVRHTALLAEQGLHPGQDLLFMALWDEPGLRLSELADRLVVERPTVTRMVARLERSGLVERRADPDDGRASLLYPTPRSRLMEPALRRAWRELGEILAGGVDSSEAEEFKALMSGAVERLRREGR